MQDKEDTEPSTVDVRAEYKRIKKIPVKASFAAPIRTGPAAPPPAFFTMGTGSLSRG
jgi:hypothetical protein